MNKLYQITIKILFVTAVLLIMTLSYSSKLDGEAAALSENTIQAPAKEEFIDADIPQEGKYDVMLDSVIGPLTYYNQSDSRWGDYLYGGKDPLSVYGCGPTVMAMVATSLTGNQVLPTNLADWAASNKSWCPGQGSYHRLIADSSRAYGLQASSIRNYSLEGIIHALDSNQLVIALMKKGHFTKQGHFIIITQYTEDGKLRIADSNNYENTKVEWDPSLILHELNHHASSGGPLWSVGIDAP